MMMVMTVVDVFKIVTNITWYWIAVELNDDAVRFRFERRKRNAIVRPDFVGIDKVGRRVAVRRHSDLQVAHPGSARIDCTAHGGPKNVSHCRIIYLYWVHVKSRKQLNTHNKD